MINKTKKNNSYTKSNKNKNKNNRNSIKRRNTSITNNTKREYNKSDISCSDLESKLSVKKYDRVLNLLGQGSYGIAFEGCLNNDCSKNLAIKFLTISKKFNNDDNHPSIIEYRMGSELSNLVYRMITPHVNLVYDNKICLLETLESSTSLQNTSWLTEAKNKLEKNRIYPEISVVINKKSNTDLKKYIKKNFNTLNLTDHRIMFFTVCYTIACAQYHIPGFRHNDIKPNNILVDINSFNDNEYDVYEVLDKIFYIPTREYTIKLYDFDFSHARKFPNHKITTTQKYSENSKDPLYYKGVTPKDNSVYDLHMYINLYLRDLESLNKKKNHNNFPFDQNTYNELISYFTNKFFLPEGTYGRYEKFTNNYRLSNWREGIFNYIPPTMNSPIELLLKTTTFDDFKKEPKKPYNVRNIYKSKIVNDNNLFTRKDMFNIYLQKQI